MYEKGRLKLKKFYFHPITMFIVLTFFVIILSGFLSLLQMQATYNTINVNTNELEPILLTVENLLTFDGLKFIISNSAKNFLSFAPLGTLLISLIGLSIAEGTGFIEMLTRRHLSKIPRYLFTFLIILISIGSTEVALINYTKVAANLIDENMHISLTSNLFFIIVVTFILSIVGTLIIEKIIAPRIGKYKKEEELATTEQYKSVNIEEEEQKQIEKDKYENRGLRYALIVSILFLLFFVYALIPNLPKSGMLLDLKEKTYLNQLFGDNSYFQDGFTYIVSMLFAVAGIAYGIGSKTVKNDKEIIEKSSKRMTEIGSIIILMFFAAQFIAVFRKTNIGPVITAWLATALERMPLSGIPLIIVSLLFIALANLFLTSPANKWMIFSPVVVPMFMQSNISPQFAQIVMRVADSMTKGFTPLLASFVIYIGYLNVYNLKKNRPYTIRKSLQLIAPYFSLIMIAWILIVVLWYIIGLPIGPSVYPTI